MYNFTVEKEFSLWLTEKLNERGWSNSELGRRSGVATSTISMIISGQNHPGWESCAKFAKAFGLAPETVFRKAGLLPALPASENDITLTDLIELAKRLPVEERLELLRYAEFRYQRYSDEGGDRLLPASADA